MDDNKPGRRSFSLGLLLLFAHSYHYVPLASGQQGISLRFGGETLPNDSFVDFDDILNIGGSFPAPTNRNPDSNGAPGASLQCITDLVDCCGTEPDTPSGIVRTEHGDWYFPNGTTVGFGGGAQFLVNRGPNEIIDGQQFDGSVRLFKRFSGALERGRFCCELPNAADPSVNQTLYVNILNFASRFDDPHVITSSSGSNTAGAVYSLMCSSTLNSDSIPLPVNVPAPRFVWSFGPSGSDPLPSGVSDMGTTDNDSITFTSTLQFSPLSQCHIGNYTCRLGPARLVTSTMVTVNGLVPINISVEITTNGVKVVGQSAYSLICIATVTGTENPSIAYQWTKNNGTQTQVGTDRVLSFSPLRLSDAGWYTCQATVGPCNITKMDMQNVTLQIPAPTSLMLSSSIPNPIPPFGSDVTLTCAVELSPAVDIPVTVNTVLTTPDGFSRTSTAQPVMGSNTNYSSTFMISSFGRSDSGIYTCSATVSLFSTYASISDSSTVHHSLRVTTGVYLALRGLYIANNSNINIRNISDNSNGALQCVTDNFRCCSQNPALGEWYQPNGTLVQGTTATTAFYRTRGANGEVSLNRPSDIESPTGLFCCEVPDGTNTNQTLCVNIAGISISIPSDTPIAGESYTLECSAGGSQAESFQWLKGPPDGRTPVVDSGSITISSTSTSSQLQFRPVQQSDNGSYSCSATTNGLTLSSESVIIRVNVPPVSVHIRGGVATPTAGENYQLNCNVSGAENLNSTITYRWTSNSNTDVQIGADPSILSFTPLRLADAASYVCEVTISSNYLTGGIAAMSVNSQDIRIQIPTLSSLMLISSPEAVVFGSDVTLTCTLGLNSAIVASDLSLLMVEIQLSRDGVLLNNSTQPPATDITFTYTTQLNSFGRSDFGNYTCNATVSPQSNIIYLTGNEILQSNVIDIRVVLGSPFNVRATQSGSSAPVEVSWSPPSDGANSINGYRIYYGNGQNVFVSSVTVITSVSLKVDRSYIGQNVSIRSEADQLYSELVNIFVTMEIDNVGTTDTAMRSCSCTTEIGITVGAVIVVVCLVAIVITVIVVLCLRRRKTPEFSKDINNTNDFAVSANMAYGEVNLKPMEMEGEYENPETIIPKPSGQGNTEATATNMYEAIGASNPAAPDYATMEEAVCVNQHST